MSADRIDDGWRPGAPGLPDQPQSSAGSDDGLTNIDRVRLAIAMTDAGYAWDVELEYVEELLKAYDDLSTPAQPTPVKLTGDQIMGVLRRVVAPQLREQLTCKRWKDGIDIDEPSFVAERLAEEFIALASQPSPAAMVECNMPFERLPQHAADPGFGPVPRSSADNGPVAWTNEAQLGFLKEPKYDGIPMAMWSKPSGLGQIPLYADQPQGALIPPDTKAELLHSIKLLMDQCEQLRGEYQCGLDDAIKAIRAGRDDWSSGEDIGKTINWILGVAEGRIADLSRTTPPLSRPNRESGK